MSAERPPDWAHHALFYHIYPLGMCGAPWRNDGRAEPEARLDLIQDWIPHLVQMGVTAVYIGPLWEAGSHGYDTVSYFDVDRRLGSSASLARLVEALHQQRIRVVVDTVFNHVGREFFAFRSLRRQGADSRYRTWFEKLDFSRRSPAGDPFHYEGWKGHYDLVKLNLAEPEVRQHLFEAVRYWFESFGIDGLRIDAADCMDKSFLQELKAFCRSLKPDAWVMGEVVMGDYREWGLDAITNYELYDSLHRSHNDKDYARLAQTLTRQFGPQGQYREQPLYNFVDNHDVNRIASLLRRGSALYPLHILLMTVPGIPSLYYGSEAGLEGKRLKWSDRPLRPFLPHPEALRETRHADLMATLQKLTRLRRELPALVSGDYATLAVQPEQLIFRRWTATQEVIVAVNMARSKAEVMLPQRLEGNWRDALNPADPLHQRPDRLVIYPSWGRVLVRQR
ncbi:MAG: alpha-amylase family glycosyl hydrolase [Candidatus Sericytochromatia bacterium]